MVIYGGKIYDGDLSVVQNVYYHEEIEQMINKYIYESTFVEYDGTFPIMSLLKEISVDYGMYTAIEFFNYLRNSGLIVTVGKIGYLNHVFCKQLNVELTKYKNPVTGVELDVYYTEKTNFVRFMKINEIIMPGITHMIGF